MWRVLVGLHVEITLLFLPVGHTKFSPDWCFGLLKKKFRRSVVSSLDELARVVEESADVNTAQLVGTNDGEVIVPTYDWARYLGQFCRKLKGIKKYHVFRFSASTPGIVFLKNTSDPNEPEVAYNILSKDYSATVLPSIVPPSRLSLERQWYLYNSIRQYCTPETRDLTCPLPAVSAPVPPVQPPQIPLEQQEDNTSSPPVKRPRRCGRCKEHGHNRATCSVDSPCEYCTFISSIQHYYFHFIHL